MKRFLFGTTLCIAILTATCSTVCAQYVWQKIFPQSQTDDSTIGYSPLHLACNGNHCTAIVFEGRKSGPLYEFLRSDDGGITWHNQWSYPEYGQGYEGYEFVRAIQQIDSLNAIAVGDSAAIFRTFDAGVTWTRQFIPGPASNTATLWSVDFHDAMNGIICLPTEPTTTSDGGLHWTLGPFTGISFPSCHCYGAGKFAVFNSNTGVIYHTSDNWSTIDSTPPIANASKLELALRWSDWTDGDTIIAYGFDSSTAIIMRTTNRGESWSPSKLQQGPGDVFSMSSISDDTLFAGRYSNAQNSLLFSTDKGSTWVLDSVPMFPGGGQNGSSFQFGAVNSIVRPAPGVILAAVQGLHTIISNGLIIRGTLVTADVSIPAPNTIGIAQVFPNPSSSSITVNFDYRLSEVVAVDVLGREVMHVPMPEAGPLTLDIARMPMGIYYLIDDRERAKFIKE